MPIIADGLKDEEDGQAEDGVTDVYVDNRTTCKLYGDDSVKMSIKVPFAEIKVEDETKNRRMSSSIDFSRAETFSHNVSGMEDEVTFVKISSIKVGRVESISFLAAATKAPITDVDRLISMTVITVSNEKINYVTVLANND